MGAYCQCPRCGNGVGVPTLREALLDQWRCPICDLPQHLADHDKENALDSLVDRIAALEKSIAGIRP